MEKEKVNQLFIQVAVIRSSEYKHKTSLELQMFKIITNVK